MFWVVFRSQEGPKDAGEASKRLLRGSQDAPRGSRGLPGLKNKGEKVATQSKMALGGDLGLHFGAQEAPKTSQEGPKRYPKGELRAAVPSATICRSPCDLR